MSGMVQVGSKCTEIFVDVILKSRARLKGGPVLLSTAQAIPGRKFSQPRAHLSVDPYVVPGTLSALTGKQMTAFSRPELVGCLLVVSYFSHLSDMH